MRIAVVGAGAIGLWIAVKLAAAGQRVCVLARGSTAAVLAERGAELWENGGSIRAPVHASQDAKALGHQDLLVFAVKSPSLPEAAVAAQSLIGPNTLILPMLNGVPWWFTSGDTGLNLRSLDPDGLLESILPLERLIGCVVYAACSSPEPGVSIRASGNRLICGEPARDETDRLRKVVAVLSGAGIGAEISEQIHRDVWYKLWGNITLNPISALTGAMTDRILDDRLLEPFILSIMEEVKEIGERIGYGAPQLASERVAAMRRLGSFKTSMLQDVEAGRTLEFDALLTAPKEIAVQLGVPTPHMDILFALTRLFAEQRASAARDLSPTGHTPPLSQGTVHQTSTSAVGAS